MDISHKWTNDNEHIKKMSQHFHPKNISKQLQQRYTKVQFRIVSFMTQTENHVNKLYQNPGQFAFNRYSTILTFNNTRVLLGDHNQKQNPENYINANILEVNGRKAIACQGPLTNTILNFWRMIQQHNISMIFMLCSRIQNGENKCDLYWPTLNSIDCKLTIGSYIIKITHEEKNEGLYTRKFYLNNLISGVQRIVTQYQLVNWPDNKKPPLEAQKHLQFLIQQMLTCIKNLQIPLVHCSAGVGRTGTFIAMVILKAKIKEQQNISIFQTVRKLREQRWGMVHTQTQYQYLYEFVQNLIKKTNKTQP